MHKGPFKFRVNFLSVHPQGSQKVWSKYGLIRVLPRPFSTAMRPVGRPDRLPRGPKTQYQRPEHLDTLGRRLRALQHPSCSNIAPYCCSVTQLPSPSSLRFFPARAQARHRARGPAIGRPILAPTTTFTSPSATTSAPCAALTTRTSSPSPAYAPSAQRASDCPRGRVFARVTLPTPAFNAPRRERRPQAYGSARRTSSPLPILPYPAKRRAQEKTRV